jgi:hypothetical protein
MQKFPGSEAQGAEDEGVVLEDIGEHDESIAKSAEIFSNITKVGVCLTTRKSFWRRRGCDGDGTFVEKI